jgi:hypothetical protein
MVLQLLIKHRLKVACKAVFQHPLPVHGIVVALKE